jgi:hypothetical protein
MPPSPHLLLLAQAAASLFMTGLIWFVQEVHYPLFAAVGREASAAYATAHQARTSWVVGPPMLLEAGCALWLALRPHPDVPRAWALWGLGLVAALWLSTALLQVPRHRALLEGFAEGPHRALVASNWLRTALWSARGLLSLAMLARALR